MNDWLTFQSIYLIAIASLSIFALVRGLFIIHREKSRRLKKTDSMDFSEPIINHEENDDEEQILTKRRAVQSIESRFEFMQRFYVPLVLFISFVLMALPFLPTLPATYLSLFTGLVAGLIGFAAKPVIENAIAGMVLTFSQPIRINDTIIIEGRYGTVEKINLLHTVIKIWNWRRLVLPNGQLLQKEIENLSLGEEDEWAYIAFHVAPGTDIDLVNRLAKEAMNSKYRNADEPATFWIMEMNPDSILCWVAGWAKDPAEAWALKSAARKNLIKSLKKHGIKYQLAQSKIKIENLPESPLQI